MNKPWRPFRQPSKWAKNESKLRSPLQYLRSLNGKRAQYMQTRFFLKFLLSKIKIRKCMPRDEIELSSFFTHTALK